MIALRLLLGKHANSPSCTYESKQFDDHHDQLDRLSPSPPASEVEYRLQKALDENTLQRLLIDQLQSQLAAQSDYIIARQQEQEWQPPAPDYTALHDRIAQLEERLSESLGQLAATVAAHTQAKAHISALQHQRAQLVLELEQMEDGFQSELEKVNGELKSWEQDMVGMDDSSTTRKSSPKTSPSCSPTHTRNPSNTSASSRRTAALTASLERAKSATRIWALEDEVDRVRHERDTLRRRLNTGRASLMQLKCQASEVQVRLGRGRERGLNKSEPNLKPETVIRSRGVPTRASDVHLNTRVRPPMRGEPITPETSDDNRSFEMNI